MGTSIEYVDSSHTHATNYIRNSKAISVLWAIFTICYAIICTVAFLTPGKCVYFQMKKNKKLETVFIGRQFHAASSRSLTIKIIPHKVCLNLELLNYVVFFWIFTRVILINKKKNA